MGGEARERERMRMANKIKLSREIAEFPEPLLRALTVI